MKELLAEFPGAFCVVFAGTGAIVTNAASIGTFGHIGIVLTFGLVVPATIPAFGDVSGALARAGAGERACGASLDSPHRACGRRARYGAALCLHV